MEFWKKLLLSMQRSTNWLHFKLLIISLIDLLLVFSASFLSLSQYYLLFYGIYYLFLCELFCDCTFIIIVDRWGEDFHVKNYLSYRVVFILTSRSNYLVTLMDKIEIMFKYYSTEKKRFATYQISNHRI